MFITPQAKKGFDPYGFSLACMCLDSCRQERISKVRPGCDILLRPMSWPHLAPTSFCLPCPQRAVLMVSLPLCVYQSGKQTHEMHSCILVFVSLLHVLFACRVCLLCRYTDFMWCL